MHACGPRTFSTLRSVAGRIFAQVSNTEQSAVAPDGRTAVSVSSDRRVPTWDLDTYSATGILDGHRDSVVALAITSDGAQAVTGGYDGRLRRWNLAERTCLQEIRSSPTRIAAVTCTPDGRRLVESGQGPTVYVRVAETGDVVTELDTGAPGVVGLTVAPDGGQVASFAWEHGRRGVTARRPWHMPPFYPTPPEAMNSA